MKKNLNIRKNEIMSGSLVHKKAFEFFKEALKVKYDVGIESFLIKLPIYENGEQVINMMESELKSDKYIELYSFSNKTFKPLSIKRELYLWKYHKHLEEYETKMSEEKVKQYLIPIKELSLVSTFIDKEETEDDDDEFDTGNSSVAIKDEVINANQTQIRFEKKELPNKQSFEKVNKIDDIFLMHLTARDLFAIIHKKPVSKKEFINKLVTDN